MQPNYEVEMRLNVRTPMRDGVELSSDIYLPRAGGTRMAVLRRIVLVLAAILPSSTRDEEPSP